MLVSSKASSGVTSPGSPAPETSPPPQARSFQSVLRAAAQAAAGPDTSPRGDATREASAGDDRARGAPPRSEAGPDASPRYAADPDDPARSAGIPDPAGDAAAGQHGLLETPLPRDRPDGARLAPPPGPMLPGQRSPDGPRTDDATAGRVAQHGRAAMGAPSRAASPGSGAPESEPEARGIAPAGSGRAMAPGAAQGGPPADAPRGTSEDAARQAAEPPLRPESKPPARETRFPVDAMTMGQPAGAEARSDHRSVTGGAADLPSRAARGPGAVPDGADAHRRDDAAPTRARPPDPDPRLTERAVPGATTERASTKGKRAAVGGLSTGTGLSFDGPRADPDARLRRDRDGGAPSASGSGAVMRDRGGGLRLQTPQDGETRPVPAAGPPKEAGPSPTTALAALASGRTHASEHATEPVAWVSGAARPAPSGGTATMAPVTPDVATRMSAGLGAFATSRPDPHRSLSNAEMATAEAGDIGSRADHIAEPRTTLERTAPTAARAPAAHADLVRQIADAAAPATERSTEIRLHPEELGRLKLGIATGESGVVVQIQAERAETLDLLRRHLDLLAEDLRRLGYGSVAFDLSSDAGDGQAPQDEALPGDPTRDAPASSEDSDSPASAPETTSPHVAAGGLDLRL